MSKDIEKLSFEEAIAKLEEASDKLKSGQLKLEESAEVYRNSVMYYNRCCEILSEAKQKIEIFNPATEETEDFK